LKGGKLLRKERGVKKPLESQQKEKGKKGDWNTVVAGQKERRKFWTKYLGNLRGTLLKKFKPWKETAMEGEFLLIL